MKPLNEMLLPSSYARALVAQLHEHAPKLLAGSGLGPTEFAETEKISVRQQLVIFGNAAKIGQPGWALRYASSVSVAMHGAMGVAVVSAPTLRDGLDAVAKFARTRDPFMDFKLLETPDEIGLEFVTDVLPLGDLELPMIEICLSFAFALLSVMGGRPVTGARIGLTYPHSANAELYAQYLPVPFDFGAARNALMLPRDLAATRSMTADPALHQNATAACTRELAAQKVYSEAGRVRWLLDASLMLLEANQNGLPLTFKQMARSLGRSERALSRELAAAGTSFRQIRDESIAHLSCRLLKTTHLPLAAIAAQAGFDDVANFSRAFKRMTGLAPGMFRRSDH